MIPGKIQHILKIALVTGAFFLLSLTSLSQNSILELLPGSEKLGYNSKTGAHRLVGSVNFKYQGNTMYCDSAHYFDKSQEVRAYGNVQIVKDGINLYCDSLYYNGKSKKAKLWGHVRVRDLEYKLTTDSLDYDAKKGLAVYRHGGKIESIVQNEVLTSRIGYFYPESKSFFFSGNVKYKSDELKMSTDTLQYVYAKQTTYFYGPTVIERGKTTMFCKKGWYNVQTEQAQLSHDAKIVEEKRIVQGDTLQYFPLVKKMIGRGNVSFTDSSQQISFKGNYALNDDSLKYSFITGNALAIKPQKKDTLYLHADTLYNQNDSLNKLLYSKAYHNAKFFSGTAQGRADSIFYQPKEEQLQLFTEPIIWSQNAELKGVKMTVFLSDSIIKKVWIEENANVLMEVDSGQYYNQIAGREILAFFENNQLVRSDVQGNAKTIFFPEDKQENDSVVVIKRIGMNRLYASDLRLYLDSGEIVGITYFDKPDGVLYPLDKIKVEEKFIPGFKWNSILRPKRWEELLD